MRNRVPLILISILSIGCVGHTMGDPAATSPSQQTCASPPPDERKFTDAAKAEGKRRREAVDAEIASLVEHPWAGEYYFGDGLGVNVSIGLAPASGFVFSWHGCLGLYDQNWGDITEDSNGVIHLNCQFENMREGFQGIGTDLQPVR